MGKFPECPVAHALLDGLDGIEIGGSAHNPFNIRGCVNVDWTAEHTLSKADEVKLCGEFLAVDVVADAAALPFADASLGYVLSSHQLEHHWDPIGVLKEWWRVVRPGGYMYLAIPHKDRCEPDKDMVTTTLGELIERHKGQRVAPEDYPGGFYAHRSFWTPDVFMRDVLLYMNAEGFTMKVIAFLDRDLKVGNGFVVVFQKE